MNLIVIKNGNEKYGMLAVNGMVFKVDKETAKSFEHRTAGGRFRAVDFDDKDNAILIDVKGKRQSVRKKFLEAAILEIESSDVLYTMLGMTPDGSYICGNGSALLIFSENKNELVTKKMLAKLRTIGAYSFLSALNRAYKAQIMLLTNSDQSTEYFMDLLEYMVPESTATVTKFVAKA